MQCQDCKYVESMQNNKQTTLVCKRYPPTVVLVPMRDLIGNEVFAIQPASPPVNANSFCGEYFVKLKAV